ncbi:hypothetical protein TNCV_3869831 [Trichonephila clavipes]|nr:hypothetical protein TNCV_3869831 [Trichonephila clavipes]
MEEKIRQGVVSAHVTTLKEDFFGACPSSCSTVHAQLKARGSANVVGKGTSAIHLIFYFLPCSSSLAKDVKACDHRAAFRKSGRGSAIPASRLGAESGSVGSSTLLVSSRDGSPAQPPHHV